MAALRNRMPSLDTLQDDLAVDGFALLSAGREAVNQLTEVIATADAISEAYRRLSDHPANRSGEPR
jgi:hypothetical protein